MATLVDRIVRTRLDLQKEVKSCAHRSASMPPSMRKIPRNNSGSRPWICQMATRWSSVSKAIFAKSWFGPYRTHHVWKRFGQICPRIVQTVCIPKSRFLFHRERHGNLYRDNGFVIRDTEPHTVQDLCSSQAVHPNDIWHLHHHGR